MKSLVFVVACLSVVGVVACSGSSEHRSGRNTGAGGAEYSAGGEDSDGGGSKSQAGKPGKGGAGSAGTGGAGGTGQPVAGEGGTGESGTSTGGTGGVGGTSLGGAGGTSLGGAGGTSLGGEGGTGEGGTGEGGTNDGGVGGVGEAGAAGEAGTAGVGQGGAGGEGGTSVHVDPVCGANMIQVGAYSLWCGKVNMHQEANGDWTHDADCKSGCNIAGVGYCQKYYPETTQVVAVDQTMSVVKDWKNAGCADSYPDGKGISGEAACCAPYPGE